MEYFKVKSKEPVCVYVKRDKAHFIQLTTLIPNELYTRAEFKKIFIKHEFLIADNLLLSIECFKRKFFTIENINKNGTGFAFGVRFDFLKND